MTSTPHDAPHPAGPPAATGTATTPRTGFWDWLLRLDLRRSDDRWLGGVAAGLAHRLAVDPLLVRVVLVVVALMGGFGLLLYAAAWLLLPDRTGRIEARAVVAGEVSASTIVALGLVTLAVVVPQPWSWAMSGPVVSGGDVVALVVVGLMLALAVALLPRLVPASAGGARPDGAPVSTGVGWTTSTARCASRRPQVHLGLVSAALGVALLAGTGAWLLLVRDDVRDSLGVTWSPELSSVQAVALALVTGTAILGVALVVAGLAGRRSDGLGFWAVSGSLAALMLVSVPGGADVHALGDVAWRPASAAAAEAGFASWAGDSTLDLRGLSTGEHADDAGRTVEVPLRHGFGEARVLVPADAQVEVRSRIAIGEVTSEGSNWTTRGQRSGFFTDSTSTAGPDSASTDSSTPSLRIVVDAQSLVGDLDIVRSAR